MLDFRYKPGDSPFVWCVIHGQMITMDKARKVMTTAYRVTEGAIIPYALCDGSCSPPTASTLQNFEGE